MADEQQVVRTPQEERAWREIGAQYAPKQLPCGHIWQDLRQFPRRRIVAVEVRWAVLEGEEQWERVRVERLECGHLYSGLDAGRGLRTSRYCDSCPSRYAAQVADHLARQRAQEQPPPDEER